MNILEEIAGYTRERVQIAKDEKPLYKLKKEVLSLEKKDHAFRKALSTPSLSIIAEVKKASPSKGIISSDFPYSKIAKDYVEGGASAISCLTEPRWFLGSNEIFSEIRKATAIPMLRKDFTVDEWQIYEARALGADAILLIAALLEKDELRRFLEIASSLGMDALVETHNAEEIDKAISINAGIIGINNRNLKDFSISTDTTKSLRDLVPQSALIVAESGMMSLDDIKTMKDTGVDGVLIGEFLMRSNDRVSLLRRIRSI